MRSEYDQEVVRCVSYNGLEQAGDRELTDVGPYHKVDVD